jgi:hypothetical protein
MTCDFHDDAPLSPAKKRGTTPEWLLQTAIKVFVAKNVAVDHEFAAHDRSRNHGGRQHLWEAARGVVAGWPDTELCWPLGRTFRCELKAPGKKPEVGGRQEHVGRRLNAIGHRTAWANSVHMYFLEGARAGVPFVALAEQNALAADRALALRVAAPPKPARSKPRAPSRRRKGGITSTALMLGRV